MKPQPNTECENVRSMIDLAATGDLPAEDRAILDAHLTKCPACERRLATRRALWDTYPVGVHPSPQLIQRTLSSVRQSAPPRRVRSIRTLRPMVVGTLAASALLLVGLIYVFNSAWNAPAETDVVQTSGPVAQGGAARQNDALLSKVKAMLEEYPNHTLAIDDQGTITLAPKQRAVPVRSGPSLADNVQEEPTQDGIHLAHFVY